MTAQLARATQPRHVPPAPVVVPRFYDHSNGRIAFEYAVRRFAFGA